MVQQASKVASAKPVQSKGPRNRLYLVAFIEGASVMGAELFGAKMAAPFFGTSLYAWAGVLAVTLLALAGGYFYGGFLTTRFNTRKLLAAVLLLAGASFVLMRFTAPAIMSALISTSLTTGVLVSLCVYLLPPIFFFGMVSPIIIHILVDTLKVTGRVAGTVYGISTIGGVLNTLFIGFYVIPEFGIGAPTLISGAIVALLPLLVITKGPIVIGSAAVAAVSILATQSGKSSNTGFIRVLHASEGLMGQLKVADFGWTEPGYISNQPVRTLFVNNTTQTMVNLSDGTSLLDYVWFVKPLLTRFDSDHSALLIGLGGGALASAIHKRGINLHAVEIDGRLRRLAREYFALPAEIPVTTDDGRHFIRSSSQVYDLIIFDAFLGENPPWHLLTRECFEETQQRMKPGGQLIIEFYGFLEGKQGLVGRSVYRTLLESGFKHVEIISTSERDGIERNLIFVASNEPIQFDDLDYRQTVYREPIVNLRNHLVDKDAIDLHDALLLTDNLPALDKLLARAAIQWRESLNARFRDQFIREKKPMFY